MRRLAPDSFAEDLAADWSWPRCFSPRDRDAETRHLEHDEDATAASGPKALRRAHHHHALRDHAPIDMAARGRHAADGRTLDGPSAHMTVGATTKRGELTDSGNGRRRSPTMRRRLRRHRRTRWRRPGGTGAGM